MTRSTVAACAIVRDAELTIERAVASIRPHVDEVCIYDTGSGDGTLELLDELAAGPGPPLRVERGEWRDDFSWAREQSFAMATSAVEWLLWFDADDVVEGAECLRGVVRRAGSDVDELFAYYDCGADERGWPVYEWRERIVRRATGHRWESVVHETLVSTNGRDLALAVVNPRMLRWRHEPVRAAGSSSRNWRMLKRAEAATGGSPPAAKLFFDLAWTAFALREDEAAVEYASRFLVATRGSFSPLRLRAFDVVAGCQRRREAAVAWVETCAERDAERAAWNEAAARGALRGREVLSPAWVAGVMSAFEASRASSVGRNDPCWCGSGLKVKRCCGVVPFEPVLVEP